MKTITMTILLICLISFAVAAEQTENSLRIEFWQTQKKGTNGNWHTVNEEWFAEARNNGFQFVRFNASFFDADDKDFLMGDADRYRELNRNDLEILLTALDCAEKNGLKVVLTMFELPGCRDGNATGINDYRLWRKERYQQQAMRFWQDLATEVKDHPAIVAYNILNEPHPARRVGIEGPGEEFEYWLEKAEGTPADLNLFNRRMVEAIREIDPFTPILLDGYFYADPSGFAYLEPVDDPYVLYAVHNPAPWNFTSYRANNGRYRYPDNMPDYESGDSRPWSKEDLRDLVEPVVDFQERNDIPSWRIIGSEIWCDRRVEGCAAYFRDIFSIYNEAGWHWSFYAFREEMDWTGFEYEMGSDPLPGYYWTELDNGADYNQLIEPLRHANPIWDTIIAEFR